VKQQVKRAPLGGVKLLSGNQAAALAVLLCHPDVICAYPITPQTPLLEQLSRFCADGLLQAEMVEVEGEHSALSVLVGAAAAGGRTFTATSSQGLAFMYEAYLRASGLRLPIVMATATREIDAPGIVASGQQDVISVRDGGWVQLHAESCQELLDTIIMAYRLAEDPDIQLPVSVCYDGFYLSHLSERVEVPTQEAVDAFLPPLERGPFRLDPQAPMDFPCFIPTGDIFTEYRFKHLEALERAKGRWEEIDGVFLKALGRSYGGLVDTYQAEDAEALLMTMGSAAGTARVVVDRLRQQGLRVGLAKVRVFRPFPRERLLELIRGKKAIGVIDRNVCFGWNCGALFMELKAALGGTGITTALASFIDGLAGTDITIPHLERAARITWEAAQGKPFPETTWLSLEEGQETWPRST
jgi:pyruvate/2-oxoacid:ferredoxin oxidoreductase alpha subunit